MLPPLVVPRGRRRAKPGVAGEGGGEDVFLSELSSTARRGAVLLEDRRPAAGGGLLAASEVAEAKGDRGGGGMWWSRRWVGPDLGLARAERAAAVAGAVGRREGAGAR